jgi:hypothetical protein
MPDPIPTNRNVIRDAERRDSAERQEYLRQQQAAQERIETARRDAAERAERMRHEVAERAEQARREAAARAEGERQRAEEERRRAAEREEQRRLQVERAAQERRQAEERAERLRQQRLTLERENLRQLALQVLDAPGGPAARYLGAIEAERSVVERLPHNFRRVSEFLAPLPTDGSPAEQAEALYELLPAATSRLRALTEQAMAVATRRRQTADQQVTDASVQTPAPPVEILIEPQAPTSDGRVRSYHWFRRGTALLCCLNLFIWNSKGLLGVGLTVVAISLILLSTWPNRRARGLDALAYDERAKTLYPKEVAEYNRRITERILRNVEWERAERERLAILDAARENQAHEHRVADGLNAAALHLTDIATNLSSDEALAGLRDIVHRQREINQDFTPPAGPRTTPAQPFQAHSSPPLPPRDASNEGTDVVDRLELKRLARARPEDLHACPFCNATVRGRNLLRHVDRQHVGELSRGSY